MSSALIVVFVRNVISQPSVVHGRLAARAGYEQIDRYHAHRRHYARCNVEPTKPIEPSGEKNRSNSHITPSPTAMNSATVRKSGCLFRRDALGEFTLAQTARLLCQHRMQCCNFSWFNELETQSEQAAFAVFEA